MKTLLMVFGYPEYHAECLAPVIWSFLILFVLAYVIGVAFDIRDRKKKQAKQQNHGTRSNISRDVR